MIDNIQHKLSKIRRPRVNITYDVETEDAIIMKSLPCIIGIIADITGYRPDIFEAYETRKFIFINQFNFNEILISAKPAVMVNTILESGDQDSYLLEIKKMEDFDPLNIINNIPVLNELWIKKRKLKDLLVKISNSSKLFKKSLEIKDEGSLNSVFADQKFHDDNEKSYFFEIFQFMIDINNNNPNNESVLSVLSTKIKVINDIFAKNLDLILHNPDFQRLEATWRGLLYLIKNGSLSETLKVRIFNTKFDEIEHDLTMAMDFDQSYLFQKLYEEEFGTYGGNPYTALLIDHYLEKNPKNLGFIRMLSKVVSCAHLVTLTGVHPSLLNLESFEQIPEVKDFALVFESNELIPFKSFRNTEESRYVGLLLPRFISRLPYGPNGLDTGDLQYTEKINSHEDFCWSNSVYLYGQRICDSFFNYNWLSSIVGPENGGMIKNLPIYVYQTRNGDEIVKCPTEVAITDRKEYQLSNCGIISLCYCKDQDYAAFFSGQSANKPLVYNKDNASANAFISSKLQYMLNASRFVHYIKCIMRDKIGSYNTPESIKEYLDTWITNYILLNGSPTQDQMAEIPLKDANITIEEDPARPGCYRAIILIQPHFQMEELTVSLRLVARMPERG